VVYQALVFTRTKHGANRLATQLEHDGITSTAIHGNKSQPQRVRALADFKANRYAILVATEVAARGLDIDSLPHVINYELPMVPEDYVHRIGRTGRAGVDGEAISLVCIDEAKMLRDIELVLGHPIPSEVIAGFEPDPNVRAEPILRGGLGGTRPPMGSRPRTVGAGGARRGSSNSDRGYAPAVRSSSQSAQPGQRPAPAPFSPRPGQRPAAPQAPRPGTSLGNRPGTSLGNRPAGPRPAGARPQGGRPAGGRPQGRPSPFGQPSPYGQPSTYGQQPRPQGARPQGPGPRPMSGPRPQGRPSQGPGPVALPGERIARVGSGRHNG
jgi:ATP-dependent RNA helicase RhlE